MSRRLLIECGPGIRIMLVCNQDTTTMETEGNDACISFGPEYWVRYYYYGAPHSYKTLFTYVKTLFGIKLSIKVVWVLGISNQRSCDLSGFFLTRVNWGQLRWSAQDDKSAVKA